MNRTIPIYLYFLQKNFGFHGKFQDQLFLFHRLMSVEQRMVWDRIFVFENQKVKDTDFDKTFASLVFHGLVHSDGLLTTKGEERLSSSLQNDPDMVGHLRHFEQSYHGEYAIEKACFVSVDHFPAACHLCTNRVCEQTQSVFQCFKTFVKPRKNPFRSYSAS